MLAYGTLVSSKRSGAQPDHRYVIGKAGVAVSDKASSFYLPPGTERERMGLQRATVAWKISEPVVSRTTQFRGR